METIENTHYIDKVVDALRKAALELEEMQVQAALFKYEARDKYEEVKKKFSTFIHESKAALDAGNEKFTELQAKLEALKVQLALGKADTLDLFLEQKKNLFATLHDIEYKIKGNPVFARLMVEIEKFKLELEMLEKRYKEKREARKQSSTYEDRKKDFSSFVEGIKGRFSKKDETKWEHFQTEISEAFKHLKAAFVTD
ncbi:MAG: hypothetical protein HKN45_04790 [Flavobacteriales bacterium]|nr:hypothetical protein [Flavobacteriales bacterium]